MTLKFQGTWTWIHSTSLGNVNVIYSCIGRCCFQCIFCWLSIYTISWIYHSSTATKRKWDQAIYSHVVWASYQIRKIAGCACAGNARNVSHRLQMKPLVSDPGMYHDTCVTHVPWCMSGSLTRGGGENFPGACGTRNFCVSGKRPMGELCGDYCDYFGK